MIKRYSENRLKRIVFFSYFYLNWSAIKKATTSYTKEIDKEIERFDKTLNDLPNGKQEEIHQLAGLFSTAILFKQNKKLRKEIGAQFCLVVCLFFLALLPGILFYFSSKLDRTFSEFLLVYIMSFIILLTVGLITSGVINFISNFEVRIGKALKNLLVILFIAGIISLVNAIDYLTDSLVKWSILSGLVMLYIVIAFSIFLFLTKAFIDFRFYSRKILITDALILESSFRLSKMNWPIVIRRRTRRQDALNELERLARLIENDWSLHLKTGDEKTTKWKNDTFKGIAEGIRSLKKQIIQPDTETPTQLKLAFEGIFQKIVNHDIKGLVGAEVPAVRIHKPSKLKAFKSVVVALLPLVLTLTIKFMDLEGIPKNYTTVGVTIAVLWLLISVLLWMDPNLADRIATISSARRLFKSKQEEE